MWWSETTLDESDEDLAEKALSERTFLRSLPPVAAHAASTLAWRSSVLGYAWEAVRERAMPPGGRCAHGLVLLVANMFLKVSSVFWNKL